MDKRIIEIIPSSNPLRGKFPIETVSPKIPRIAGNNPTKHPGQAPLNIPINVPITPKKPFFFDIEFSWEILSMANTIVIATRRGIINQFIRAKGIAKIGLYIEKKLGIVIYVLLRKEVIEIKKMKVKKNNKYLFLIELKILFILI